MRPRTRTTAYFKQGQAVLTATTFFIVISLALVLGVSGTTLRSVTLTHSQLDSKQSYVLAESLVEDVTYRLKEGKNVESAEELTLAGHTAFATTTDVGQNNKRIEVVGDVGRAIRAIAAELTVSSGVAFNYGVQVGNAGFHIDGGSTVYGNVYSNGPITGGGGGVIDGSAVSALSAVPTPQYVNDTPIPETGEIIFGETHATQDVAQSFTAASDEELTKVAFYIRKINWPQNLTVRIVADNNGEPDTVTLASASLQAYLVGASYGWYEIPLTSAATLVEGERYWIVLDGGTSSYSQYAIAANSNNISEEALTGRYNNSSWNDVDPAGRDGYLKLYSGGIPSEITGTGTYVGALTVNDNAWADSISNASVGGSMWCEIATVTNKECETGHGSPPEAQDPVSESNTNTWKDEAEAGGIQNGDMSVDWEGATIGPQKITGDLSVSGGGILTLTGTVWVEGDLSLSGGASVDLDESYGEDSGVLIVDGRITITGGTDFSGSGVGNSYPLIITTSTCPDGPECNEDPAIELSGGSGAIVLVAQNGTVVINGGTAVKSVTGHRIELSGGATIEYEQGLVNARFESGPSGGYSINEWQEIE